MSNTRYEYTFRHKNNTKVSVEIYGLADVNERTISGIDNEGCYFCVFLDSLCSFERKVIR